MVQGNKYKLGRFQTPTLPFSAPPTVILNISFPRLICVEKSNADFSSVTTSLFLPPCLVALAKD